MCVCVCVCVCVCIYICICICICVCIHTHIYICFQVVPFALSPAQKKISAQPAPCTPSPERGGELTLERVDSDTNPPPPSQRASATLRQCNAGW